MTNVVSFKKLRARGYWWDNKMPNNSIRRHDNTEVALLKEMFDQNVLEYVPLDIHRPTHDFVFKAHQSSRTPVSKRRPRPTTAQIWHERLGHPNPEALQRLVNASIGVRVKGPTTVQCDQCGTAKAKRIVSRAPRYHGEFPGQRVAVDLHDFTNGYDGSTTLLLITDRMTMVMWDYYLTDHTADSILMSFHHFLQLVKSHYNVFPTAVECDNEFTTQKPRVRNYLEDKGITVEPSAPYTQAQNGGAERSGGVVKEKIRAMVGNFPDFLWPEICKAAVYLLNRTPRYGLEWKTPYEKFFKAPPTNHHLRVYGCKAFALTTVAKKKAQRLKRLSPRAWIGYLVGYSSTNLYRIWHPSVNKVFITRDVSFDENCVYDGSSETLQNDLKHVSLETWEKVVNATTPDKSSTTRPLITHDTLEDSDFDLDDGEDEDDTHPVEDNIPTWRDEYTTAVFDPMLTPPETPPTCLFTAAFSSAMPEQPPIGRSLQTWEYAFIAAQAGKSVLDQDGAYVDRISLRRRLLEGPPLSRHGGDYLSREEVQERFNKGIPIYRHELEPPPKDHFRLKNHSMRDEFVKAEQDHLKSHENMKSWSKVTRGVVPKGAHIFDCMWVYVYKFHPDGRYLKCKARLVVRGDQETRSNELDTYAATLAGRSIKMLIAIATYFDLEMVQYDAVNAFVNAPLDKVVYMRMPPGYREQGMVLFLHKALYGLRKSPLLWQRHLTSNLRELGFEVIPHEPCCMSKEGLLIFFHVDDMTFAFRQEMRAVLDWVVTELGKRFKLTGGGDLQWFLGVQVIRDRARRLTWLCQASAIDKLRQYSDSIDGDFPPATTPMAVTELVPYEGLATPQEVHLFQRKVGSLLYVAVTTRPDIAFATSRLARYMTNPSPAHHKAANRVIGYLLNTRTQGLQYGHDDGLEIATDASFADNTLDRKSSQGYAIKLFGGLIAWKANKQDTVTTSSTEAELLGLSQTAKEALYIGRLLSELKVSLDDNILRIKCDNQQTIRLLHSELAVLNTRLRHVDIHNHWLRQEVAREHITIEYVPSKDNMADGFTKPLQNVAFRSFVRMLGLTDIRERLKEQEKKEVTGRNLLDVMEAIYAEEDTCLGQ